MTVKKIIRFRDVQPGDVVSRFDSEQYTISMAREWYDGKWALFIKDFTGHLSGAPNEFIGLIHRPWPEGKTEEDMLNELDKEALIFSRTLLQSNLDIARSTASRLRAALETYELGKPLEE